MLTHNNLYQGSNIIMLRGKFDLKIGTGLLKMGAINHNQLEEVLKLQKNGDKRLFGQIAVSQKFTSKNVVENYLKDIKDQKNNKNNNI